MLGDLIKAPKCLGIVDNNLAAKIQEPLSKKTVLRKLITCLQTTYEGNFPAALLTLGAQMLCTHYEALNEIGTDGCVPATILHGDVSHGKSLATKVGLSMLGIQNTHFLSSVTNNRIVQVTSSTTLVVVFDDPSDVKEISEKILHHFERGVATNCKGSYTPRCTFVSSVNKEILNKLVSLPPRYTKYFYNIQQLLSFIFNIRYITRVVLIRFAKITSESTMTPSQRREADRKLSEAMKQASRGVGTIIALGQMLTADESAIDALLNKIKDEIPEHVAQRVYMSYALLLHSTFKVCLE